MRTFDFSPFARNAIGFENLFDRLNDWSRDTNEGYPPYDIVRKGEDQFQINIAVAGFSRDEITITAEASQLTVAGRKPDRTTPNTSIRVSRRVRSNGASIWPTTSRSKALTSRTACSTSTLSGAFRKDEAAQDRYRQRHTAGTKGSGKAA